MCAPYLESRLLEPSHLPATSSSFCLIPSRCTGMKSRGIVQKWTWYRQGQGHWIKLPMEREGSEHVAQSTESLCSRQEPWVQAQHHMNQDSGVCL